MSTKAIAQVVLLTIFLFLCPSARAQPPQQPCTPGISYWKLMESVGIGYRDGKLHIGKLYALCLPEPTRKSDSIYPYDPDGGGRLTTLVRRADGTVLNTFVWQARESVGLWEMNQYKVLGGPQAVKPFEAGQYILEFAVEDQPICRFPFSVVQVQNQDPYEPPGPRYFMEGAWNDYGNLFYQRNDPESPLRFTTWLQDKTGLSGKRATPYEIRLVRIQDDRLLAEDSGTLRLEPRWLDAKFLLRPPGGDKGKFFQAAGVLGQDGAYAVRLQLDGKLYGEYPFEVSGGRIQFQGRQVREKTDPLLYILDYLYGGRVTSWWIERKSVNR